MGRCEGRKIMRCIKGVQTPVLAPRTRGGLSGPNSIPLVPHGNIDDTRTEPKLNRQGPISLTAMIHLKPEEVGSESMDQRRRKGCAFEVQLSPPLPFNPFRCNQKYRSTPKGTAYIFHDQPAQFSPSAKGRFSTIFPSILCHTRRSFPCDTNPVDLLEFMCTSDSPRMLPRTPLPLHTGLCVRSRPRQSVHIPSSPGILA